MSNCAVCLTRYHHLFLTTIDFEANYLNYLDSLKKRQLSFVHGTLPNKRLFDSCFPSNEISDSWPLLRTYISYHRSNTSYSVQLTDLFLVLPFNIAIHFIHKYRLHSIRTADLFPWLSKPKVSKLLEIFNFCIRVSVDNDTINSFEGHSNCKLPYFGKNMKKISCENFTR